MKELNLRKNNRGIALISIMIAVSFITVIAAALLAITYTNFRMKVQNLNTKENFYETDGQLTKISTLFRYNVSDAGPNGSEADMDKRLKDLCMDADFGAASPSIPGPGDIGYDPSNPTKTVQKSVGVYNVQKLASLAWEDENRVIPGATTVSATAVGYDGDRFSYVSNSVEGVPAGTITKIEDGSITTYILHDFQITQTKKDEASSTGDYSNTVDTHIVFRTKKYPAVGGDSNPGGVGSCSSLMDGTLRVENDGSFSCLNVYGNAYFSNYGGITSWDGGNYTAPGKYSATDNKAAINLMGESKMNLLGDITVVYGDIVLNGNSTLYVNGGKLKVIGDIIINDNATLVCSGKIYMVDEILPGRTFKTSVKVNSGTANDHCYPHGLENASNYVKITKDQYIALCAELGLNDNNATNDGLTYQMLIPVKTSSMSATFDLRNGGKFESGATFKTTYYGQEIGVAYWQEQNMQSSLGRNLLIFNSVDGLTIKESQDHSTIISPYPIKVNQTHSISLTNLGPETFKYLCSYKNNDTAKDGYDSTIHNGTVRLHPAGGSTMDNAKVSPGDFFTSVDAVNNKVNAVLGIGDDASTGSGASYKTSLSFTEYQKDFN